VAAQAAEVVSRPETVQRRADEGRPRPTVSGSDAAERLPEIPDLPHLEPARTDSRRSMESCGWPYLRRA
jgi:hypothetical protein